MDEYDRPRLLAARAAAAAAAAGYPGLDPASAVAAHAAQLRAAVAAAYPELGRVPTTSGGGSASSAATAISDAAFHSRFSPGSLSIGAGAGLPFLNSLFAGSIPPPPTSPYRNAHGGLVSMRPFWPPTPPPDTYSRCGLGVNYYPMFSSSLVPSTDSSHYNSHSLQIPSRISPANTNSFTNIFDPHKDVPYLSPTLRLGSSPLAPNHSIPQHSPTSPSPYLHLPSPMERHALSYLHTPNGGLKGYEFPTQPESERTTPRLSSPLEGTVLKKEHSDSMTNLVISSEKNYRIRSGSVENNNNIEGPNKKFKDQSKVATVKVYKHKNEASVQKTEVEVLKEKKPVIDTIWPYPLPSNPPLCVQSTTTITSPVNNGVVTATVAPSLNLRLNRSKKVSIIAPTSLEATKCCNCSSSQEENVKVEELSEDQESQTKSVEDTPFRKELLTPLTIETSTPLLAPKIELISPDPKTPVSPAVAKLTSKETNNLQEQNKSSNAAPNTSTNASTNSGFKTILAVSQLPVGLTSRNSPVSPANSYLPPTSSCPSVVTTSISSSSSSSSLSNISKTTTKSSWVHHPQDASVPVTSVINTTAEKRKCSSEVKVTPHIGATPLPVPLIKSYVPPCLPVPQGLISSPRVTTNSNKCVESSMGIRSNNATSVVNKTPSSDGLSGAEVAEAVNLCIGKAPLKSPSALPVSKRAVSDNGVDVADILHVSKENSNLSQSKSSEICRIQLENQSTEYANHQPSKYTDTHKTVGPSDSCSVSGSLMDKVITKENKMSLPPSLEITKSKKECKLKPNVRETVRGHKYAQSVKPNQRKLDRLDHLPIEQNGAINLSLGAKKSVLTDVKEPCAVRSPERASSVLSCPTEQTNKLQELVSSSASLNALSRLVSTSSCLKSNCTELVSSASWNFRGVQKVKPSSMVSSIQSENMNSNLTEWNNKESNERKVNEKNFPAPKITVSISTSSTVVTTSRPTITTTMPATQLNKAKALSTSNISSKDTFSKNNPVHNAPCANAVLSMQETVSSTMLSVTSSVIPSSGGNSTIPVGIAVAQLRQDSSNITVKRSLPVSSGIDSTPTNCPPLTTLTRPICGNKSDASDGKKTSHSTTETNILVSQVHCTNSAVNSTNQMPVTHWESESLVRTSLPSSWLTPAPVVASAPVVTPTVWVGQAPFTTAPTPTATATLNSLDGSQLPLPPVGLQLARDPISGQMFLLPASNIEIVDRSNIWSTYTPGTVQQIVTQPTAFHQQIIQQTQKDNDHGHSASNQVTNGTKTEVKPCISQIKKSFLQPANVQTTNHIEAAHETKEVKVIGAGGLNATVQSTVAGITVQSNQPFTFPGFAATNGVPATLSYFYEPPTILHLTQTQATTALQPTSLHASAIAPSVLQSNGLQVTGVQSTTGIQITNIQQQQPTLNSQCESFKRSQATSPLNSFSPSMEMHHSTNGNLADSADDEDAEDDDSENENFMDSQIPKPNTMGVTMAIQVDMDASTDNNDYEEHPIKAVVEVHDSANQTDTFSDSAKEDTGDECSRGMSELSSHSSNNNINREKITRESVENYCVTTSIVKETNASVIKSTMEVQTDNDLCADGAPKFTVDLKECNHDTTLMCHSMTDQKLSVTETNIPIFNSFDLPTHDVLKIINMEIQSDKNESKIVYGYKEAQVQDECKIGKDEADRSPRLEIVEDLIENVPNDEVKLQNSVAFDDFGENSNSGALNVVENIEENPPLLPTKSHMVMDFIDHHGLDLLVDSIEEFASREEQDVPEKNSTHNNNNNNNTNTVTESKQCSELQPVFYEENLSVVPQEESSNYVCDIDPTYTDGLGILCALAEQRFLEEHKKSKESKISTSTSNNKNNITEEHARDVVNVTIKPESRKDSRKSSSSRDSSPNKYSSSQVSNSHQTSFPNFTSEDSMDPSEVEMRFKLAELQRKYREKQRELAKLKPKKEKEDFESNKKERSTNKSKKNRLSIFTSKFGMSFPYLQIPEDSENFSDSHSESSSFSPNPVIQNPIGFTGSPAKKKRKLEKDSSSATDTLPNNNSSLKQLNSNPNSLKRSSSSKKSNNWSSKVKTDGSSASHKSTSSCSPMKSDHSNKKSTVKPVKSSVSLNASKDNDSKKGSPEFSNSIVKPQSIMSPRTSSDSEGERLFVQFWTNQRAEKLAAEKLAAEKLAAANNTKLNESTNKSKENGKAPKQSSCSSVPVKAANKSETVQRLPTYEVDTSESEDLPQNKKAKLNVMSKSQGSVTSEGTKTVDEIKEKKIKSETVLEDKSKVKKKSTNKPSASTADSTWNRRRSERIFLHDAGVVLPSTFVLVDEQSNGSICRDILIEPAKPILQRNEFESNLEKLKKSQSKSDTEDSKDKKKFKAKKEKEKSVPDELFAALRQCRLSEAALAGAAIVGEAKSITNTRSSTQSDESSFSEGDVPLSILMEKNSSQSVPDLPTCILSPEKLVDQQRVITQDDDLYYAGYIKAIQAPDVYGIVLDGERGNKPHIFSREELLSEGFVEIKPTSTLQIPIGSRVCAYWSQQYRHLYPGTVAKATSAKHIPEKGMVFVEFDDGDSGRIPIEDIRILPQDTQSTAQEPQQSSLNASAPSKMDQDVVDIEPENSTQGKMADLSETAVTPPTSILSVSSKEKESRVDKTNMSKIKKNKKLAKSFIKKSSKKLSDCCSPASNGSDSSSIIPLSFLKNKSLLKKKSKKSKGLSSKNKLKEFHRSSKRSSDNSSFCMTSSPNDESSNSGSLSSGKIKKKKKHKTEHKHRHHHHRHHCHHSHHHKKHKHDKLKNSSSQSSTPALGVVAGPSSTDNKQTILGKKTEKIIVSVPVLPTSSTNHDEKTSIETISVMKNVNKPPETKSKLTVKIKAPVLGIVQNDDQDSIPTGGKEMDTQSDGEINVFVEEKLTVTTTKKDKMKETENREQKVPKKKKERQNSVEKSKIAAFLPAKQIWGWSGKGFKRQKSKGKGKKEYHKSIKRGDEIINVGDCAVFLSTGRPHLPYVGRIDTMWQSWGGNMVVKVVWFYHPEETKGGKKIANPKGALYESSHVDENDVQTISHKCEVLSWDKYQKWKEEQKIDSMSDSEDVYYLAGTYDPLAKVLTIAPGVS